MEQSAATGASAEESTDLKVLQDLLFPIETNTSITNSESWILTAFGCGEADSVYRERVFLETAWRGSW